MNRIDANHRHKNDPLKWKKHLVLVDWRIRDKIHLLSSINRYNIKDYLYCLKDIAMELDNSNGKYTFIIKLVYKYKFWKLPNIVISSKSDLMCAKQAIEKYNLLSFAEIWFCKNETKNYNTVFGRMLISNSSLFPNRCSILYELVWSGSARNIELYPNVNCPYISIERSNWNANPIILELSNKESIDMLYLSKEIISKVSAFTPEIKDFASFVFSMGCNHLCIEFSYCNNALNFIDWDSDNDKKVLKTYEDYYLCMNNCSICSEVVSNIATMKIKEYFKDSRIFAQNEYLCVFPTVGCFIKGYILLATKDHYLSLFNCTDKIINEVSIAIKKIELYYKKNFNKGMVYFEHGTVDDYNLSPASVCHLHIHIMPVNKTIWSYINEKYNFKYYEIVNLSEIKSIVNVYRVTSYILFGDYDGKLYLIDCSKQRFPSQFFRKVMYEFYYGSSEHYEWDWKKYPYYNLMTETLNVFNGMKI